MRYILVVMEAIAQRHRDGEVSKLAHDHESDVKEEIGKLSEADTDNILNILFQKGTPADDSFYDSLRDIYFYLGYSETSKLLVTKLWIKAFHTLKEERQGSLLNFLVRDNTHALWSVIDSIPGFCSSIKIEPKFASNWFLQLAEKVKNDLAGGGAFQAVIEYARHFPDAAIEVFEEYVSQELQDLRLSLGALLLGVLRSIVSSDSKLAQRVRKWDELLKNSRKTTFRLCYYRSLTETFDSGILSVEELNANLSKMLDGEPEEIDEAFGTVNRCLLRRLSQGSFVLFAMDWFSKHASAQIPDLSKHHVVDAMWRLCSPQKRQETTTTLTEANQLLVAIQPIPTKNLGTWNLLEYYLVDRLRDGPNEFEEILGKLTKSNTAGLVEQFEKGFDYIKSELSKGGVQGLLTRWLLSKDKMRRRIGNQVFQNLASFSVSEEELSKADEIQLQIALLEFIRKPLTADKTSEYLLMLEPRFRKAQDDLKNRFKKEMTLQAINYPGACLERWEKVADPSELLQEVLASAKKYFENLRRLSNSSATNFTFPEYKEAAERGARDFSFRVGQGAKEKSVIAKFAKSVQILYGSLWSIMVNGELREATPFQKVSSAIEFPRLERIDPEGTAIRRIQATIELNNLEKVWSL
jgi:hypothetical protein